MKTIFVFPSHMVYEINLPYVFSFNQTLKPILQTKIKYLQIFYYFKIKLVLFYFVVVIVSQAVLK
jgi:hypothetical protein